MLNPMKAKLYTGFAMCFLSVPLVAFLPMPWLFAGVPFFAVGIALVDDVAMRL